MNLSFGRYAALALAGLLASGLLAAEHALEDRPFVQESSLKLRVDPALAAAHWRKVIVDRDGVVYALSDLGVARVYNDFLAPDRSFRPLAGRRPLDIALSSSGDVYYLYESEWLSNGDSGRPRAMLPARQFEHLAVAADGQVWLAGPGGLARSRSGAAEPEWVHKAAGYSGLSAGGGFVLALQNGRAAAWPATGPAIPLAADGVTAIAAEAGRFVVGSVRGRRLGFLKSPNDSSPWETRLPSTGIRNLAAAPGGYWAATDHGAFFESDGAASVWAGPEAGPEAPAPRFRYYAGRRWLADDEVIDIAVEGLQRVWLLTRTGLQAIEYRRWTLEQKADWFYQKVRSRHIRYGLSAERRLARAGDVSSGEMQDTDNDGGWSSYWLAGQAFRYAVTRSPQAKASAWETFEALARLQSMHTNTGFPARTMERTGFKASDPDQWRTAKDPSWEWKGHTSSDEIAAHMFAYAILWECAADTPAEKRRIAEVVEPIVAHILDHNLYLVDADGKPTLWGRWHPEYVNHFPPSVYDRRLNSSEIIAALELAWKLTGKERYRSEAFHLFETAGYLRNITNSMQAVQPTGNTGNQGISMGDDWNHSDDELGFITYWVMCRFAFTDALRRQFTAAVEDHWRLERGERYPFWNYVAAGCGLRTYDSPGAVWTLRGWPLDTITWRVTNSKRGDLTRLPPNFRGQEMVEILPPGERQATRCNTQPFILDAGDDGSTEFAGDEYLLGYWMGRFVGGIRKAP